MANFANLSTDCVNVATQCIVNNNKQDMAIFIITQDRLIREQNIKAKHDNTNNASNSGNNSNNSNTMSDRRMQALNRLKAHMK